MISLILQVALGLGFLLAACFVVLLVFFVFGLCRAAAYGDAILADYGDDEPIPFIDAADQACALTVPHTEDDPDLIAWLQCQHPWDELAERRWRREQ